MADNHDTESSDSDDHFSDALSGHVYSGATSPVYPAEVPAHDETPEAHAHAVQSSTDLDDADSLSDEEDSVAAPTRDESTPTPPASTTRIETDDSDDEEPKTLTHEQTAEDAVPDIAFRTEPQKSGDELLSWGKSREDEPDLTEEAKDGLGSPTSIGIKSPTGTRARRTSSAASRNTAKEGEDEDEDAGFGDDFDDFEEGEQDAEFDDFEEGFQEAEPAVVQSRQPPAPSPPVFSFPILDFSSIDSPSALTTATEPYLDALFPSSPLPQNPPSTTTPSPSSILTPRSSSLWSQLVAPPPLQPPNWIRSRIRRLFLVSLGVPIDLDEILPASKQKKLILPSTSTFPSSTPSKHLPPPPSNLSSTSLDSLGRPRPSRKPKPGPAPAPNLDLVSARQLCSATEEALRGRTDEEIAEHVRRLEGMRGTAEQALEYWVRKTDEMIGDREAFEGVIENLVKHARKVRK